MNSHTMNEASTLRRQRAFNGLDLGEDVLDHAHRVHADLAANFEHDGRLVLVIRKAALFAHAVFGVPDITDTNGRAGDVLNDDVVEFIDVLDAAERADAELGGAPNDAPARRFDVLGLNRPLDFLRAQVVGIQLVQVEKNVDLPLLSAADIHPSDAIDGLDTAADGLIRDLGQLAH
jgi:hypothetical protein